MKFEDLSPDLQERAKGCKSAEDILALAKDEGYELSDDELESVSGGAGIAGLSVVSMARNPTAQG